MEPLDFSGLNLSQDEDSETESQEKDFVHLESFDLNLPEYFLARVNGFKTTAGEEAIEHY